jgi:hypothetical protein
MADPASRQLALLIDADNVPPKFIAPLMEWHGRMGWFVVRRLYGNLTTLSKVTWRNHIHQYALSPVLAIPATGTKDAADMKLAIDAMDLVHARELDGICIASSDSDFTLLAIRIRESGFAVYGFGEEKTPAPYRSACDTFYRLGEAPPARGASPSQKAPAEAPAKKIAASSASRAPTMAAQPAAIREKPAANSGGRASATPAQSAAGTAVHAPSKPNKAPVPTAEILASIDESAGAEGWAALSTVRQKLGKRLPNFNLRTYGFSKFSDLVTAIDGVEKHQVKLSGGGISLNVRRRTTPPPA